MLKRAISVCLISILSLGLFCETANAQCDIYIDGLKACDKSLTLWKNAYGDLEQLSKRKDSLLDLQLKEINHLKESKQKWYNNTTLWGIAGFFLGGYAVYKLRK